MLEKDVIFNLLYKEFRLWLVVNNIDKTSKITSETRRNYCSATENFSTNISEEDQTEDKEDISFLAYVCLFINRRTYVQSDSTYCIPHVYTYYAPLYYAELNG